MENSMVNINNSKFLRPEESLTLIQTQMANLLPQFKLNNLSDKGEFEGYGVEYIFNEIEIFIGGEKGGLDYKIFLNGVQQSLFGFNPNMKKVYAASEENYKITIEVIKDFLASKKLI
jgi:hypothetical protein